MIRHTEPTDQRPASPPAGSRDGYSGPYQWLYAEWYDRIYHDKPYEWEAAAVHDLIQANGVRGQRLLEVACGTASHSLAFHRLGYDVTGVDISPAMLELAAAKSAAAGANIEFLVDDMRRVRIDRSFDAAVCLFDAIGFALTDAGVRDTLRHVADMLEPGGVFVFEFWNADAVRTSLQPRVVRRFESGDQELIRISEVELEPETCVAKIDYDLIALAADHTYRRHRERQQNRGFTVDQMRALIANAGLEPVSFQAGFAGTEAITNQQWHIVAVARRAADGK